jgi:ribosome maturation factor RimP
MDLVEEIKNCALDHLPNDQFIVDVTVSAGKGPKKIKVTIDGDNGVGIDDCALLSRVISTKLEELGLDEQIQNLEVTTPGLDKPLMIIRQYVKNIGRRVKIQWLENTVEGKLLGATQEAVTLQVEKGKGKKMEVTEVVIPYTEIKNTFVLVSFK